MRLLNVWVTRLSINRWNPGTHWSQVGGKLAPMVDFIEVEEPDDITAGHSRATRPRIRNWPILAQARSEHKVPGRSSMPSHPSGRPLMWAVAEFAGRNCIQDVPGQVVFNFEALPVAPGFRTGICHPTSDASRLPRPRSPRAVERPSVRGRHHSQRAECPRRSWPGADRCP